MSWGDAEEVKEVEEEKKKKCNMQCYGFMVSIFWVKNEESLMDDEAVAGNSVKRASRNDGSHLATSVTVLCNTR